MQVTILLKMNWVCGFLTYSSLNANVRDTHIYLFPGKTVSEKKDTIDAIAAHFNIQVDNPMCMLNQDVAKNFLNTKSIKDKYNVC